MRRALSNVIGRGPLIASSPVLGAAGTAGVSYRRSALLSTAPTTPLLDGIVVLELASVLAGPSVCQFLAELGATVIKVENVTTTGDVTRTWRLPADRAGEDVTAYFSACNLGKRSVAVNLRDDRGLDAVHRLAASADVCVASYKPGDAEKLRVDYATLAARNPRLVYAQITGYGLDDARAGYDAVIQAESGFQLMNGEASGPPTKMPVAMIDLLAAHQLKEALLAALWRREREGGQRGAFIDCSLLAAGVSSLANQATGYLRCGTSPRRMGSDHPSIVPYGSVFTCADGHAVVLAVGADKQFRQLCAALGDAALAEDGRFTTNPKRVAHRDECKARVGELIRRFDRDELLRRLRAAAVPAGAVNEMRDVFAQPQAEALVVRRSRRRGDAGGEPGEAIGLRQVAFSVRGADGRPETPRPLRPPPRYAEHTREVLTAHAGFSAAEVEHLIAEGAAAAAT